ncbi:MAG: glycoside hydrolase family 95 protein [Clostridia bacterium]|nr:glycoside hydrolase family 95 protein [Clostridia bacterium]
MEKFLKYGKSAKVFEEALPLGNGQLGAMIYGRTDKERISLNHDTLWSGKPGQTMVDGAYEANELAKQLVMDGKNGDAQWKLECGFTGTWLNSYLFLGTLYIERLGSSASPSKYIRTLDLENSIVKVNYEEDGIDFEREYFVSFPDNCVMVKLRSSKPVSYELTGECIGKSAVTADNDKLYLVGECPSQIAPEYASHEKPIIYDGEGVKVTGIAKVVCDGKSRYGWEKVTITDATDVTIYFCAETSFVAFDKKPDKPTFKPCLERVERLAQKSYEEILAAHTKDVNELYNRVTVDFGGEETDKMTDERLHSDNKDVALCELLYNFGRYLIIASSREGSRATNLQGIWNEKFYAAWSSNYTVNINTEMNYWPVLMCNLVNCNLPMVDLVKNVSINGEETAKHFYHAKGFTSHHNIDLWANTTPVGNKRAGCAGYAYWKGSSGWLCRHLFEHYEYTLDKEFLANTAYPIMKKCAEFYLDIMTEIDGKLVVCPSTSPENAFNKNGYGTSIALYTAMSQGIVEDLFRNITESAKVLGIDDEFTREVAAKTPMLNVYEIGSDGQLLEYDEEYEERDIHHRHVSHLYGMYPGTLITTESTPELANACRRTLERRGDESTGWSMGWKVCLWAKLKDGDRAFKLVKTQLKFVDPTNDDMVWGGGGTYANMFDAHPPFQIDGNFGVTAGITQMFLQCEDGKIKILPALPSDFKNGKIGGLLAKGNIKVDIEWKDSKLSSLKLSTPIEQTTIINIDGKDMEIKLAANEEYVVA